MTPRHELLSQKELARCLGVHVRTLQRWIAAGDWPESVNDRWSWTFVVAWLADSHASATEKRDGRGSLSRSLRKAVDRLLSRAEPVRQKASAP